MCKQPTKQETENNSHKTIAFEARKGIAVAYINRTRKLRRVNYNKNLLRMNNDRRFSVPQLFQGEYTSPDPHMQELRHCGSVLG